MGFFTGLEAEPYDRTYSDRELIRRIVRYFQPYRTRLLIASVCIVIIAISGAAVPIIIARGVDLLAANTTGELMLILVAGIFLLGILIWFMNWIRRRLVTRVTADVMLDLRRDAFLAASEHDLAFYDEFSSGRVVSRITSDTQDFSQMVVLVTDLITQFIQALILIVVLVQIDLRLTIWLLAFLPIIFLVAVLFRNIARRVTRRGFRAMANVNAAIKESVTGISVAKNFRQEPMIYQEFELTNQTSYRTNVQRGFVLALVFPTLNAIGGIGTALLIYLGGLSVLSGLITAGAWYLFIESLDRFWFPVLNLSAFWTQLQNGLSSAERVFALIDATSNMTQTDNRSVPKLHGEIEFKDLCFQYVPGEVVLKDFNLSIPAGENLALVGHTGAGKSSIAKLISRFYEFQDGDLLVDGKDIRSFDLGQYRNQLGIVSQTPFLFSGTVVENIHYARPDSSIEEVCSIVNAVGDGEWLDSLPDGLDTQVGERGGRLSMGQRQLISLMRVLVQRPAIFILDEATASIDPFTESQIQDALELILANSTSILIAHRLSTVKAADRILVLRQGQIIEEGNHQALMNRGSYYAELYNTYFRHQSLSYIDQAKQAVLD
jgi:ATP-binding cassette subfamily B protein